MEGRGNNRQNSRNKFVFYCFIKRERDLFLEKTNNEEEREAEREAEEEDKKRPLIVDETEKGYDIKALLQKFFSLPSWYSLRFFPSKPPLAVKHNTITAWNFKMLFYLGK